MSSLEDREKRRRRLKHRSDIAHDLHSKKYRQRVVQQRKKSSKTRSLSEDYLWDDDDDGIDPNDNLISNLEDSGDGNSDREV